MTKYGELRPWLISMKILSQKNVHKLNYIIVNFTQNNEVSIYIKNKKFVVYQSLILNDSDEQNGTTGGYTPQQWVNFAKTIQQSSLKVTTKEFDRGERTVGSTIKTWLWSPEICWYGHAIEIRNGLKYIRTSYNSLLRNWEQRAAFMQQQKLPGHTSCSGLMLENSLYSFQINECYRMDDKLACRTLKLLFKLLHDKKQVAEYKLWLSNTRYNTENVVLSFSHVWGRKIG